MNPLVRSLLAILDAHPLVTHIRVVQLDETPTGRLEVKIRCRVAPNQHHFHDEHNNVSNSPLKGEPGADLQIVLDAIGQWLELHSAAPE